MFSFGNLFDLQSLLANLKKLKSVLKFERLVLDPQSPILDLQSPFVGFNYLAIKRYQYKMIVIYNTPTQNTL